MADIIMETNEKMINNMGKFTHEVYIDFLKFLNINYKIITFSEVLESNSPYLLIRHDVDASLENALLMAKIESGLNIRSTYFVLFSNKLYNILERDSLNTLRKISNLGHEIGIHYDLETYKTYHNDLTTSLENEVELLESLLKRRISSIACHNPWEGKPSDPFRTIEKYIDAYNTDLYDLYVSDSCRAWYLEDLAKLIDLKFQRVQLLIHPFLWTRERISRDTVLERYFQEIEKKNLDFKLIWKETWHKAQRVKVYDRQLTEQQ